MMQTSTGDTRTHRRLGVLRFVVAGEEAVLTLFADEAGGLFLPFADALAGQETYEAGRYLEPEPLADGRVLVDFNLAYNPCCAYNDDWSCPLTPPKNRLRVAIRAGEHAADLRPGLSEEVLRLARAAETAGLDLIGIQDHPYQPRFLDTWTLLATIAGQTERVRLFPDVACLPLRPRQCWPRLPPRSTC